MIRPLLKSILVMMTLTLATGLALNAQESKEAKPAPKDPVTASKPKAPTKKAAQHVPNYMVGETSAPTKPQAKPVPPKARPRKKSDKVPHAQRIDINTASKEELKKLPGIFDAEAAKIIAGRPYKSKAGLVVDAGLTGAQYFAIKDRVIAGQVLSKTLDSRPSQAGDPPVPDELSGTVCAPSLQPAPESRAMVALHRLSLPVDPQPPISRGQLENLRTQAASKRMNLIR